MESINEFKFCKSCNVSKDIKEFKKYRLICLKCMYKKNNTDYKEKFKEYYKQQQEKRLEYQNEYYKKKVNKDNIEKSKVGRKRTVNVKPNETTQAIKT